MEEHNTYQSEYNDLPNHEVHKGFNEDSKENNYEQTKTTKKRSTVSHVITQVMIMTAAILVIATQTNLFSSLSFEIDKISVGAKEVIVHLSTYEGDYIMELEGNQYYEAINVSSSEIVFNDLSAETWYKLSVVDADDKVIFSTEFKTHVYEADAEVKTIYVEKFSYDVDYTNQMINIHLDVSQTNNQFEIGYIFIDDSTHEDISTSMIDSEFFEISADQLDQQSSYELDLYYIDENQDKIIFNTFKIYY